MQTTTLKKALSLILCIVLIAAMALCTTGCSDNKEEPATKKSFIFTVVDKDGKETVFNITSEKKTVGEALQDEGLIAGEEGEYGLYVKTVNGMLADHDVDQTYWSFTISGEMAMTGVDQTELVDGTVYGLVRTK